MVFFGFGVMVLAQMFQNHFTFYTLTRQKTGRLHSKKESCTQCFEAMLLKSALAGWKNVTVPYPWLKVQHRQL